LLDLARPEHNKPVPLNPLSDNFHHYYLSKYDTCGFEYKFKVNWLNISTFLYYDSITCPQMFGNLSGSRIFENETIGQFAPSINFKEHKSSTQGIFTQKAELLFYKIDSCSIGTPVNFIPLRQSSFARLELKVYPNPANNYIHVEQSTNTNIQSLNLFSLKGKRISTCTNCDKLATGEISNGLYILNIETDKGVVRKKILIQH